MKEEAFVSRYLTKTLDNEYVDRIDYVHVNLLAPLYLIRVYIFLYIVVGGGLDTSHMRFILTWKKIYGNTKLWHVVQMMVTR